MRSEHCLAGCHIVVCPGQNPNRPLGRRHYAVRSEHRPNRPAEQGQRIVVRSEHCLAGRRIVVHQAQTRPAGSCRIAVRPRQSTNRPAGQGRRLLFPAPQPGGKFLRLPLSSQNQNLDFLSENHFHGNLLQVRPQPQQFPAATPLCFLQCGQPFQYSKCKLRKE